MRSAAVSRKTHETDVTVQINLDGNAQADIATGIGFFDHMLSQIARHGMMDLKVHCQGDLDVDGHHSVEDVGIAFGEALREALGDRKGIVRYGMSYVPLDESLSRVVIDISGRPGLVFSADISAPMIGALDTQLVKEFFQAFVNHAAVTLHVDNLRGENAHHQVESIFKAFGRALREAVSIDGRAADVIPSTKGCL